MSLNDDLLLDCYSKLAHEETLLFNRRESWNSEDAVDEKYIEYLMPTSTPYFSRLRPLFSFEVKSLSSLNNFSHILFRDGALFLLRFFIRFKSPGDLRCKILIHEDFCDFVPEQWKEHIYFYKLTPLGKVQKMVTEAIVHLVPDTYRSVDELALEVRELKANCRNIKKFKLLVTHNTLRGEDYLDYCRFSEFNAVDVIKSELGSEDFELLKLESFWSKDLSQSLFYSCKGTRLLNSDSFFEHHALACGAQVHGLKTSSKEVEIIDLSPHHAMSIKKDVSTKKSLVSEFLFNQIGFPDGELFTGEPADVRGLEDYFKVFYYSKDLLELASHLNFKLVK